MISFDRFNHLLAASDALLKTPSERSSKRKEPVAAPAFESLSRAATAAMSKLKQELKDSRSLLKSRKITIAQQLVEQDLIVAINGETVVQAETNLLDSLGELDALKIQVQDLEQEQIKISAELKKIGQELRTVKAASGAKRRRTSALQSPTSERTSLNRLKAHLIHRIQKETANLERGPLSDIRKEEWRREKQQLLNSHKQSLTVIELQLAELRKEES